MTTPNPWSERDGMVIDVLTTLFVHPNAEVQEKARKSLNIWIQTADYLEPSLALRHKGYLTMKKAS